jgi:hypothetical protein
MPTLDGIVRHLALFCHEDCADISGAGIVATIAMFLLQLPEYQQLVNKLIGP